MFKPDIWVKNVLEIDRDFLTTHHIRGLILDLDNTLSMHGSPAAEIGVEDWLDTMRQNGVKMMVVSNNTEQRVEPLARQLGLEYVSFGCKPLPKGIRSALKKMNLPKKSIALVGDQIFTDVLGGNLSGVQTVLVEPFHLEDTASFKVKRKLEGLFFKRDYSKLKRK